MAQRTESSITVDAPPAEVLAVLVDLEALPRRGRAASPQVEVLSTDDGRPPRHGPAHHELRARSATACWSAYDWTVTTTGTGTVSWSLVEPGRVTSQMDGSYELVRRRVRHHGHLPPRGRRHHLHAGAAAAQGREGHHRRRPQGPQEARRALNGRARVLLDLGCCPAGPRAAGGSSCARAARPSCCGPPRAADLLPGARGDRDARTRRARRGPGGGPAGRRAPGSGTSVRGRGRSACPSRWPATCSPGPTSRRELEADRWDVVVVRVDAAERRGAAGRARPAAARARRPPRRPRARAVGTDPDAAAEVADLLALRPALLGAARARRGGRRGRAPGAAPRAAGAPGRSALATVDRDDPAGPARPGA